jgi:hypothetical protein
MDHRLTTAEIDKGRHKPRTPWDDPQWREQASSWIATHLDEHGLRTADAGWRIRLRPWSVIFRIPLADTRVIWFKANPAASRFEPALLRALSGWRPDDVLTPLAINADKGWSLQPDGGSLFAHHLNTDPAASIRDWEAVIRQYAAFQQSLAPHTEAIAATGVPRCPTTQAPDILAQLIDGTVTLSAEDRTALKALLPEFTAWCTELTSLGIPDTLDHADLHEAQILGPDPTGHFHFFDWGDAVIGHPFASLRVTLRVIRTRFGPDTDTTRLRDIYLEPWTSPATPAADLRRGATLACRVAVIGRALAWGRLFEEHLDGPNRSLDPLIAESLAELLNA